MNIKGEAIFSQVEISDFFWLLFQEISNILHHSPNI